jgi:hypothetical protein
MTKKGGYDAWVRMVKDKEVDDKTISNSIEFIFGHS